MPEEKLVLLDFLWEDVSVSNVEHSKKFSRLIWLHAVFAVYVASSVKWDIRASAESEKEKAGGKEVWEMVRSMVEQESK